MPTPSDVAVVLATTTGALASLSLVKAACAPNASWWWMSPARARRRVDPRCDERAWADLFAYSLLLCAPAVALAVAHPTSLIALALAATALLSLMVAYAVMHDSPRAHAGALMPFIPAVILVAWVSREVTTFADPWGLFLAGAGGVWSLGIALLGWKLLIAMNAQEGARRIAYAALFEDGKSPLG